AFRLTNRILTDDIAAGRPYVHIEDFSNVLSTSLEARKYFIDNMKKREHRLLGVIFFGASPMFKMSIKLGKRLNIVKFDVHIVKDYSEAVKLALKMLSTVKSQPDDALVNVTSQPSAVFTKEGLSHEVVTNDGWYLQLDSFSARFEIIDGHIFHADTSGSLEEEHVAPIFRMQEKVINSKPLPKGSYYFVGGAAEVKGSRKARKLYYNYVIQWYKDYPFRMYIFYGANRFLRAAINIASPLAPFPVRMVKDLDSALKLIAEERSKGIKPSPLPASRDATREPLASDQTQQYVDELLHFLGSIDWETDGFDYSKEVDPSHPFMHVFDAISVLKNDLDDLLQERKRAQEERVMLEAQLQRAQKMEAIGTLAGGVAHDLNNILAGLVSYPELMNMEIDEMLGKVGEENPLRGPLLKMKKSVGTIQKSGNKSATIVQDLLTLARRGVAVTEVANLNSIIAEYLISPEYEKLGDFHPNAQMESNLEEDLLNILGSPVHLSKTVMNLVSNAAEAMPEGGKISISTENQYIDRPIRGYDHVKEGDYVVLRVSDTGVGISEKDRERIFEPFYTKKVMGRSGTGLGMAVVWGTVKDHRGYIDIESTKGKGTAFTLYFPVTRKELPKDKSLVSIEEYMGKGESVLVIDDVEEQREVASRMLKRLGYFVRLVSSGEEAVDYMKENSADLLVLDMIMDPGIDGYETYKRILEFHPNQKAIIVSGFAETERVKEAQRLGAGAYVKKPFLLQKIGLAVRDELDR
ncbi:MAG: ATP-binding protein, partial [Thermoplasmata archaeon]